MKTWMPMETAPKDRRILVLRVVNPMSPTHLAAVAKWNAQTHHSNPKPYWEIEGSGAYVKEMRDNPPLGWMPLPGAEPTSPFEQQAQIFLALHAACDLLRQLPTTPDYFCAKEVSALRNALDMLAEVHL